MPTISMFRGIKVCIYWSDHMPPHLHAFYGRENWELARNQQELFSIEPLR